MMVRWSLNRGKDDTLFLGPAIMTGQSSLGVPLLAPSKGDDPRKCGLKIGVIRLTGWLTVTSGYPQITVETTRIREKLLNIA